MSALQQIYAVIVALQNDTLLLPNLAVAEVVACEGLRRPAGAPDWYAGLLNWQEQEIPVVRFELLNNSPAQPPGRRTRVAIVNCVGRRLAGARFGLLCEGYPHLVTLNRAALRTAPYREQDNAGLLLARVRVASSEAAIPDLEKIEEELAGVQAAAA